jgi:large subunit ribosomal protein L10
MPLSKEQKQNIIEELKEKIAQQKAMLFFGHSRLKAPTLFSLRKRLKKEKSFLRVTKKTLFLLALKDTHPGLVEKIKEIRGQISVIFSPSDEIGPSKELYRVLRENPDLKIWGGFFREKFQEPETIIALAQLPSKQELLASLTGILFNPVSGLVNTLRANLEKFVFVISQIKSKPA